MPLSARSFVVAVGALITAGLVEVAAGPGPRSRADFSAMGTAKLLIPWDANSGERGRGPQILPDSREVLFTLVNASDSDSQIVVESLDTRERRVLIEGGTDARYLPTGHLVYALAGNLLAVPFALDRLEVIGGPVRRYCQELWIPFLIQAALLFKFSSIPSTNFPPCTRRATSPGALTRRHRRLAMSSSL